MNIRTAARRLTAVWAAWVAYNMLRVYLRLRARQRKLDYYRKNAKPPTLSNKIVTREEYETMVEELLAKATNPEAGFLALLPAEIRPLVSESCSFLCGGAAALIQSAHPFVADGVTASDSYRVDVTGRFHKTFLYVFKIFFGDCKSSVTASKMVFSFHSRVKGKLTVDGGPKFPKGTDFTALNEDALLWVHSTLLDYNLFGSELAYRQLTEKQKDTIVQFYRYNAPLWGIRSERVPTTWREFEEWYFGFLYSDNIHVSENARQVASFLMRPILWEAHLPVTNSLRTVTGVLLPDKVSKQYGFKQGPYEILYTAFFIGLFRSVYSLLPDSMRQLTPYREFLSRLHRRDEVGVLGNIARNAANKFVETSLKSVQTGKPQRFDRPNGSA